MHTQYKSIVGVAWGRPVRRDLACPIVAEVEVTLGLQHDFQLLASVLVAIPMLLCNYEWIT